MESIRHIQQHRVSMMEIVLKLNSLSHAYNTYIHTKKAKSYFFSVYALRARMMASSPFFSLLYSSFLLVCFLYLYLSLSFIIYTYIYIYTHIEKRKSIFSYLLVNRTQNTSKNKEEWDDELKPN